MLKPTPDLPRLGHDPLAAAIGGLPRFRGAATLCLAATVAGCGGAARAPEAMAPMPVVEATSTNDRLPHTAADVAFMTGMIHHHAQAVLIAGWAPTHGASDAVRRLSERIVVGQRDEIALMEQWLEERGEPVPDPETADSSTHTMPGMDHSTADHAAMMPGMLTADELARLDSTSGAEFDRMFLRLMIKHHQGALVMVDELFKARGAAQDEPVFRIASGIHAEQTTEIDRMQNMLATLLFEGTSP